MRSRAERLALVATVALAAITSGCSEESTTEEPSLDEQIADADALAERPCPDDSSLTYENFGEGFFLSWCNGCHASALGEDERQDAPLASNFDDLEQIRAFKDRVWLRSADHNVTMPPVGGPEDDERARLGEWLACGAPSTDD